MSLKKFNLDKIRSATGESSSRLTMGDLEMLRSNSSKEDDILRSVFSKTEVSRKDYENGKVNAGVIFLSENYMKSAQELAQKTKEASAQLSPKELQTFADHAYYVQIQSPDGDFDPKRRYISYQGKTPLPVKPDDFYTALLGLYKVRPAPWQKTFSVVNGMPDSPYFVPIDTPVVIPRDTISLPLGFSFDPTAGVFRVFYVITGDVMFGYVYRDASEAMKGRNIHASMLDWALPPEILASQYQKWYGTPQRYDAVFKELHKEKFGEYPIYRTKTRALTAGGEILSRAFVNWKSQRVVRDTILSNFAGLSGITGNSSFTWDLHSKIVQGQKDIISNPQKMNGTIFSNGKSEFYSVANKSQFNNIPPPPQYIQKIISKVS